MSFRINQGINTTNELNGVSIKTKQLTNDDIIVFNGTKWINQQHIGVFVR